MHKGTQEDSVFGFSSMRWPLTWVIRFQSLSLKPRRFSLSGLFVRNISTGVLYSDNGQERHERVLEEGPPSFTFH